MTTQNVAEIYQGSYVIDDVTEHYYTVAVDGYALSERYEEMLEGYDMTFSSIEDAETYIKRCFSNDTIIHRMFNEE